MESYSKSLGETINDGGKILLKKKKSKQQSRRLNSGTVGVESEDCSGKQFKFNQVMFQNGKNFKEML